MMRTSFGTGSWTSDLFIFSRDRLRNSELTRFNDICKVFELLVKLVVSWNLQLMSVHCDESWCFFQTTSFSLGYMAA
jgi:hypothetical protein